jgi:hypothetical protein
LGANALEEEDEVFRTVGESHFASQFNWKLSIVIIHNSKEDEGGSNRKKEKNKTWRCE